MKKTKGKQLRKKDSQIKFLFRAEIYLQNWRKNKAKQKHCKSFDSSNI